MIDASPQALCGRAMELHPGFQGRFNFHQHNQLLNYADILSLLAQVARFLQDLFVDKLLHWGDT
jgi:hypothetical protein